MDSLMDSNIKYEIEKERFVNEMQTNFKISKNFQS